MAYGAGKAALDKMTADMALDLRDEGVAVVSLWPNVTRTERVDAAVADGDAERLAAFGAVDQLETPRFSGRAVVALAADPDRAARSGRAYWVAALGRTTASPTSTDRPTPCPTNPGRPRWTRPRAPRAEGRSGQGEHAAVELAVLEVVQGAVDVGEVVELAHHLVEQEPSVEVELDDERDVVVGRVEPYRHP